MDMLITICARGGSKGVPGKNTRYLNGKPLIAYTIQIAQKFAKLHNADIALSTDDKSIMGVAADYGLITNYIRPGELALDTTGKIETIVDLLTFHENINNKVYDYILDLDVTSPLRTIMDLEKSFEMIQKDGGAFNLFSVSRANRNPYFNMVEKKENGYYNTVKEGSYLSRQVAPEVYDMNSSFYFYKRIFFSSEQKKTTTTKSLIYIMPHVCFDIDHMIDYEIMEFLIHSHKLGFDL